MLEYLRVVHIRKVTVIKTSLGVRLHNTIEELAQALFTFGAAQGAAEVLGGDDRRSIDAPEIWKFNPTLFKDGFAGLQW